MRCHGAKEGMCIICVRDGGFCDHDLASKTVPANGGSRAIGNCAVVRPGLMILCVPRKLSL